MERGSKAGPTEDKEIPIASNLAEVEVTTKELSLTYYSRALGLEKCLHSQG